MLDIVAAASYLIENDPDYNLFPAKQQQCKYVKNRDDTSRDILNFKHEN